MSWEQIFEEYINYRGEESVVEYLKNNYYPPFPKQNKFQLNENKCTIVYNNKEIKFQKRTFKMLKYVYDNSPKIITREEIYNFVWEGMIVEEKTIDTHVYVIRKAIPEIPLYTHKKLGLIWKEN